MKRLFIWGGIVAVVAVGGFMMLSTYIYQEKQASNGSVIPSDNDIDDFDEGLRGEGEEPVFCTMDAKMCPDGSYVGRQGPSCEFAACTNPSALTPVPSPTEPVACTMDAKMCPDGSYVGRQGPNCEFAPCPGETR